MKLPLKLFSFFLYLFLFYNCKDDESVNPEIDDESVNPEIFNESSESNEFVEISIPDKYDESLSSTNFSMDDLVVTEEIINFSFGNQLSDIEYEGIIKLTVPTSDNLTILKCEISASVIDELDLNTDFWRYWSTKYSNDDSNDLTVEIMFEKCTDEIDDLDDYYCKVSSFGRHLIVLLTLISADK